MMCHWTTLRTIVPCLCVEDRVLAAKSLVARLRTTRRDIIDETNRLCVAYVELANYDVDKFKGKNGGELPRAVNIHVHCSK